MSLIEKLDDLLTKLDEPAEVAETAEETPAEETETDTPEVEAAEQNESSEDVPADETSEKLAAIVIKQHEQIASLNNQIATLIKGGAQISDGKEAEVVNPPAVVPDEYEYLKDLDFSYNESEMNYGTN